MTSDLIKAAILGLVEGATEFIPVSSTGHLIVAGEWLEFTGAGAKTFEVFIQLGAILAIVWLYRATFRSLLRGWRVGSGERRLLVNLGVAFLPAAGAGFLAHTWIKAHLFGPLTVAGALIAGGVAILLLERVVTQGAVEPAAGIPTRTAFGIGLAQVLSLFPGVSRSGATIMGGYVLGLTRRAATEFSFFLAVPVMVAATLFDLWDGRSLLSRRDIPVFAAGFAVSFVSALVVVKAFLAYVSRHRFTAFAWYRIGFGVLVLLVT